MVYEKYEQLTEASSRLILTSRWNRHQGKAASSKQQGQKSKRAKMKVGLKVGVSFGADVALLLIVAVKGRGA